MICVHQMALVRHGSAGPLLSGGHVSVERGGRKSQTECDDAMTANLKGPSWTRGKDDAVCVCDGIFTMDNRG